MSHFLTSGLTSLFSNKMNFKTDKCACTHLGKKDKCRQIGTG